MLPLTVVVLATLIVLASGELIGPQDVEFVIQPADTEGSLGNYVKLRCSIKPYQPNRHGIRWQFYPPRSDGGAQIIANSERFRIHDMSYTRHETLRSNLLISKVSESDEGLYNCIAYDTKEGHHLVSSSNASLTIFRQMVMPTFLRHPDNITANETNEASLSCQVDHLLPEKFDVRWVKASEWRGTMDKPITNNDQVIARGMHNVDISTSDGTESKTYFLTFNNVSRLDAGGYFCAVYWRAGGALIVQSSKATLRVLYQATTQAPSTTMDWSSSSLGFQTSPEEKASPNLTDSLTTGATKRPTSQFNTTSMPVKVTSPNIPRSSFATTWSSHQFDSTSMSVLETFPKITQPSDETGRSSNDFGVTPTNNSVEEKSPELTQPSKTTRRPSHRFVPTSTSAEETSLKVTPPSTMTRMTRHDFKSTQENAKSESPKLTQPSTTTKFLSNPLVSETTTVAKMPPEASLSLTSHNHGTHHSTVALDSSDAPLVTYITELTEFTSDIATLPHYSRTSKTRTDLKVIYIIILAVIFLLIIAILAICLVFCFLKKRKNGHYTTKGADLEKDSFPLDIRNGGRVPDTEEGSKVSVEQVYEQSSAGVISPPITQLTEDELSNHTNDVVYANVNKRRDSQNQPTGPSHVTPSENHVNDCHSSNSRKQENGDARAMNVEGLIYAELAFEAGSNCIPGSSTSGRESPVIYAEVQLQNTPSA